MARGPPECPLRSDHVIRRLCSWAHPPYISSPEHPNFILLRERILHLRQELSEINLPSITSLRLVCQLSSLAAWQPGSQPSLPSCRILYRQIWRHTIPTPPAELLMDKSGIEPFFFSIRHLQHGFWQAWALSLRNASIDLAVLLACYGVLCSLFTE